MIAAVRAASTFGAYMQWQKSLSDAANVPPTTRYVATVIATFGRYGRATDKANPSHATIGSKVGLGERAIARTHVKALLSEGWLVQRGKPAPGRPFAYDIAYPAAVAEDLDAKHLDPNEPTVDAQASSVPAATVDDPSSNGGRSEVPMARNGGRLESPPNSISNRDNRASAEALAFVSVRAKTDTAPLTEREQEAIRRAEEQAESNGRTRPFVIDLFYAMKAMGWESNDDQLSAVAEEVTQRYQDKRQLQG